MLPTQAGSSSWRISRFTIFKFKTAFFTFGFFLFFMEYLSSS